MLATTAENKNMNTAPTHLVYCYFALTVRAMVDTLSMLAMKHRGIGDAVQVKSWGADVISQSLRHNWFFQSAHTCLHL